MVARFSQVNGSESLATLYSRLRGCQHHNLMHIGRASSTAVAAAISQCETRVRI